MVHHHVLSHEAILRALCSGQSLWPCTPDPVREARRRRFRTSLTLSKHTINAQQMLLPLLDLATTMPIKNPITRVLFMQMQTFHGRFVRLGIEEPMPPKYAPFLSLLRGEVCLDPMDPRVSLDQKDNLGPEVFMRSLWPFPPEDTIQPVMDITTVSENDQGSCECRDRHEDRIDLRSLGGLPWARQGSGHGMESMGFKNNPPTCPTTMVVKTASIGGDFSFIFLGRTLRQPPACTL